jgi:hypothetical protein
LLQTARQQEHDCRFPRKTIKNGGLRRGGREERGNPQPTGLYNTRVHAEGANVLYKKSKKNKKNMALPGNG